MTGAASSSTAGCWYLGDQGCNESVNHRWRASKEPRVDAEQRMARNFQKAILEHQAKAIQEAWTFDQLYGCHKEVLLKESLPKICATFDEIQRHVLTRAPLSVHLSEDETQGTRPYMQDVHFSIQKENSALLGIFDGHGYLEGRRKCNLNTGKQVAEYASKRFPVLFDSMLTKTGHVHHTFETTFDTIQMELETLKELSSAGTTALVCYIEKKTKQIYTATLSDSEARIYRRVGSEMKVIPLSPVRGWKHGYDVFKGKLEEGKKKDAHWLTTYSKEINWRRPERETRFGGLNVSRSLGDVDCKLITHSIPDDDSNYPSPMTHKPKITSTELCSGDRLILGCDGLWELVEDQHIIANLDDQSQARDLIALAQARTLEDSTLPQSDNITVLLADIGEHITLG